MELSELFRQPLVIFLAGVLATYGILLITKFFQAKTSYQCQMTVQLLPKDSGLEAKPDKAHLYLGGEITWDNQLNQDVTIEFEKKKGRRGPFPKGTFPIGKKAKAGSGKSDADPGLFTDYWKYSVTTAGGTKLDPGVRIKK